MYAVNNIYVTFHYIHTPILLQVLDLGELVTPYGVCMLVNVSLGTGLVPHVLLLDIMGSDNGLLPV